MKSLKLNTFNNDQGTTLFKALGHPAITEKAQNWRKTLSKAGRIAIFDPLGDADTVDTFYNLKALNPVSYYVQKISDLGGQFADLRAELVSTLGSGSFDTLLITAFDDGERFRSQVAPLTHRKNVITLDDLRLDESRISNKRTYVDPKNFATNFAFFREQDGLHTRITTTNYWKLKPRPGEPDHQTPPVLWCILMDEDGGIVKEWEEKLPGANGSVVIDSREVKQQVDSDNFCGSLFLHAIHPPHHDQIKYALDIFDENSGQVSCNHDANAWPSEFFAGVVAPEVDETGILWVQNSHPLPIPADTIGMQVVGAPKGDWSKYGREIPPFGTRGIRFGDLLPDARFPTQIKVHGGEHFVRPRFEILHQNSESRRIAHANVWAASKPTLKDYEVASKHLGQGYIMPLPVLPLDKFRTVCVPTPMTKNQKELPLRVELYDSNGGDPIAEDFLGRIPHTESRWLDIDQWLEDSETSLESGSGHVQYRYDLTNGGVVDGWLHAWARFELRETPHRAETIFGAHIYNTPITYHDEPQSYSGAPPGLTTRLFLRLGQDDLDTICHLIYPSSLSRYQTSTTNLFLRNKQGDQVAERQLNIPERGSCFWRYSEMFNEDERRRAGDFAYIEVNDRTCRLFGFHGLLRSGKAFCLDHMFGY